MTDRETLKVTTLNKLQNIVLRSYNKIPIEPEQGNISVHFFSTLWKDVSTSVDCNVAQMSSRFVSSFQNSDDESLKVQKHF
jgi:hypothetical protein